MDQRYTISINVTHGNNIHDVNKSLSCYLDNRATICSAKLDQGRIKIVMFGDVDEALDLLFMFRKIHFRRIASCNISHNDNGYFATINVPHAAK